MAVAYTTPENITLTWISHATAHESRAASSEKCAKHHDLEEPDVDILQKTWPGITSGAIQYMEDRARDGSTRCHTCRRSVTFWDVFDAVYNRWNRDIECGREPDEEDTIQMGTFAHYVYEEDDMRAHGVDYKPRCKRPCCQRWADLLTDRGGLSDPDSVESECDGTDDDY